MGASGSRIAGTVIVLTTLICVVAFVGDGPVRGRTSQELYTPTRADLREVGVITDDFPVPGALPPEIFPTESWDLDPPGPPAWLLWLLGAIAAAGLVVIVVRMARALAAWRPGRRFRLPRRRRTIAFPPADAIEPGSVEPQDDVRVARRAVDAALAPLREAADPRSAVIEAYTRMERVLAEQRLGRRASEAPREYLRRVLSEHGMPEESLTTLTALFEEARFSRHPIPESAPRRAASELRTAQVTLARAGGG